MAPAAVAPPADEDEPSDVFDALRRPPPPPTLQPWATAPAKGAAGADVALEEATEDLAPPLRLDDGRGGAHFSGEDEDGETKGSDLRK